MQRGKLRFDIPPYEAAMRGFFEEVLHGFRRLNPLLGEIQFTSSEHGGIIRNLTQPVLDQPMSAIGGSAELPTDAIRHTRIEEFTGFLSALAKTYTDELERNFFRNIGAITNATGNVFDSTGTGFSFDTVLDALDRMPLDFDQEGRPQFPTVVIPPELTPTIRSWRLTPEQLKRRDEIIEKKRAEFNAAKRTRRLS